MYFGSIFYLVYFLPQANIRFNPANQNVALLTCSSRLTTSELELSLTVSPWGLGPWFASRGMSHVTWFALSFVRANTLFHGPWI